MPGKVVDLDGTNRDRPHPPVSDFWFAQIDVRLSRIEALTTGLGLQILAIACGVFGLLVLEIIRAVTGA